MVDLTPGAFQAIIQHALAGAPDEVCGVLLGKQDVAIEAVAAKNVDPHPLTRYTIDPLDLYAAVDRAEREGLDVVGFYHSHPAGPPHPSETDAARATWAGAAYVILSLQPFKLGAWRWRPGFQEEPVRVVRIDRED